MQKTKYFTCFYHSVLFYCFKTLFDYEIEIYHSAEIDYKDFMKIYRECTKEPFNFLTIDITLPASDPLRF